ncbi:MAG: hypothetical protein ACRCW1_03395 [Anaerotignaceae bacterium]
MNFIVYVLMFIMPGGWIVFGLYKLYTMFIQKRSHDTIEMSYHLSNYVLHRKGYRHKPYTGSYINLTGDISYVSVDSNGNLQRKFYA